MTRPGSLQGRLLLGVLGIVGGVWLAAALLTWRDARHELDELLDGHLAQAAALLVAQQLHAPDEDERLADAPSLHRYAPRVAFQVWHAGALVLRSAQAPAAPLATHAEGFRTLDIGDARWRVFAARGAERDVQVYVGEQTASREAILRAVMRGVLGPLVVALPLLALLGWWAVRRGLRPLHALGEALAARAPDALQPVALPALPAELAAPVGALNALFARIAALLEGERRFTADAAHELRTPIAAIRAQAQAALAAQDEPSRRHALEATLAGCDRAAHLVEQLLILARLEAQPPAGGAALELRALARETIAGLAPQALARGQRLSFDAPAPCPVRGDAALLGVLLRNLLDNAIRYSPPRAPIAVALRRDGDAWMLTVDDAGPGLDAAQRARLGERFFRVLGSGASGSGLGWSIARRIAAAHGFVLEAAPSAALGGLRVSLAGRAADEPAPYVERTRTRTPSLTAGGG